MTVRSRLGTDTGGGERGRGDHQGANVYGKKRKPGGALGCCDIRVWTSREAKEGGTKARVGYARRRQLRAEHRLHRGSLAGCRRSKPEVGPQEEGKREAGRGEITASF